MPFAGRKGGRSFHMLPFRYSRESPTAGYLDPEPKAHVVRVKGAVEIAKLVKSLVDESNRSAGYS